MCYNMHNKNQKGNVMADQFDNNKDNDQEQKYEKFCFLCRRPESQAGKMIDLPNHIHICADCMQKSFDTMNTQMNNGNYSDLFNMPNVSMIDLSSFQNPGNQAKKIKKKSETPKPVIDLKDIPAPHKIKATLDEYVIGQEYAKKVMSERFFLPVVRVDDGGDERNTRVHEQIPRRCGSHLGGCY